MAERVARVLNLLGADRDLLGANSYELLELIATIVPTTPRHMAKV